MAKQRSQPKVGDRIAWRYPQFDAETDTPSEEPDWFYGTVTEATSTSVGVVFDDGDRCECTGNTYNASATGVRTAPIRLNINITNYLFPVPSQQLGIVSGMVCVFERVRSCYLSFV